MMPTTDPLDEPMDGMSAMTVIDVISARDTLQGLAACGAVEDGPFLHDLLFTLQQIINVEATKCLNSHRC